MLNVAAALATVAVGSARGAHEAHAKPTGGQLRGADSHAHPHPHPLHEVTAHVSNLTDYEYPTDYYGIDISQSYGESTFSCLKGLNLNFAIIRCYESVGRVDPSCAGSAAAANAAGMDVHAYMFPCPTCGNPAGQVATLLSYWEANKVNVKRLWLDIEGEQYWTSSHASNQAFYEGLVNACKANDLVCGVYSSASQWGPIFGSLDFTYGNNLPLWYADYDGVPSFDNWAHFGGWSGPTLKQFTDQGSKCGCSYDISWGPSLPE